MNTWEVGYVKFLVQIAEPYPFKEPGWSLGLKHNYIILSGLKS